MRNMVRLSNGSFHSRQNLHQKMSNSVLLAGIFAAMDESGDGLLTEDEMILSTKIFTFGSLSDQKSTIYAN